MNEELEAIEMLFDLYCDNFVKELIGSSLNKALTDEERQELFKIASQSISQTIKYVFDKCNEEKIEGDRKDA